MSDFATQPVSASLVGPGMYIRDPKSRPTQKPRKVSKVSLCKTNRSAVHLDHECHDTRFPSVIIVDNPNQ